jgi:hypothetical protein
MGCVGLAYVQELLLHLQLLPLFYLSLIPPGKQLVTVIKSFRPDKPQYLVLCIFLYKRWPFYGPGSAWHTYVPTAATRTPHFTALNTGFSLMPPSACQCVLESMLCWLFSSFMDPHALFLYIRASGTGARKEWGETLWVQATLILWFWFVILGQHKKIKIWLLWRHLFFWMI